MLDSLVGSPGQPLGRLHTIPLFSPRTKSKSTVTPAHPSAHARLPRPCVDALLTLAQGYSMVRHDIPHADKLVTFLQIHGLTSWYR
jgi:hypothetical protein